MAQARHPDSRVILHNHIGDYLTEAVRYESLGQQDSAQHLHRQVATIWRNLCGGGTKSYTNTLDTTHASPGGAPLALHHDRGPLSAAATAGLGR